MNFFKMTLSVVALLVTSMAANAGYIHTYSVNGGLEKVINPLSSTDSAAEYYNYFGSKPHPAFGTEDKTAFFWLYEESDTGILSLGAVFDGPHKNSGGGRAFFTLSGMPSGWEWVVQDDNSDIGGPTDITPTWKWSNKFGDGGMISNLEDSEWTIDWLASDLLKEFKGIDNWYFLSAGEGKYVNAFNLGLGDTLRTTSRVPEPPVYLLMLAGILAVGSRSCLRKKA